MKINASISNNRATPHFLFDIIADLVDDRTGAIMNRITGQALALVIDGATVATATTTNGTATFVNVPYPTTGRGLALVQAGTIMSTPFLVPTNIAATPAPPAPTAIPQLQGVVLGRVLDANGTTWSAQVAFYCSSLGLVYVSDGNGNHTLTLNGGVVFHNIPNIPRSTDSIAVSAAKPGYEAVTLAVARPVLRESDARVNFEPMCSYAVNDGSGDWIVKVLVKSNDPALYGQFVRLNGDDVQLSFAGEAVHPVRFPRRAKTATIQLGIPNENSHRTFSITRPDITARMEVFPNNPDWHTSHDHLLMEVMVRVSQDEIFANGAEVELTVTGQNAPLSVFTNNGVARFNLVIPYMNLRNEVIITVTAHLVGTDTEVTATKIIPVHATQALQNLARGFFRPGVHGHNRLEHAVKFGDAFTSAIWLVGGLLTAHVLAVCWYMGTTTWPYWVTLVFSSAFVAAAAWMFDLMFTRVIPPGVIKRGCIGGAILIGLELLVIAVQYFFL